MAEAVATPTPDTRQIVEQRLLRRAQRLLIEDRCFRNPWCIEKPTPKQAHFLSHPSPERLFGGAAGPGKSSAILMAAAMWADVPEFNALILRRSYQELALPGGLMDRAHDWWDGTAARWSSDTHTWSFPPTERGRSGASITFGYLGGPHDRFRYRSTDFQLIALDELVDFRERDYRWLFSRLRKDVGNPVPLQMLSASNPPPSDDLTGQWVGPRFVFKGAKAAYIPARLADNPYIDQASYLRQLAHLDPVTRAQLINGDWEIRMPGRVLDRVWFPIIEAMPQLGWHRVGRGWDLAATEPNPGEDADWTVGLKVVALRTGVFVVTDVRRAQLRVGGVRSLVKQTAVLDDIQAESQGMLCEQLIEQQPGSAGKGEVADYARILAGHDFRGVPISGKKLIRAKPIAAQAQSGNVLLLRGPWNSDFLDEVHSFTGADSTPSGVHDDQVDALSLVYNELALDLYDDEADWAEVWRNPIYA